MDSVNTAMLVNLFEAIVKQNLIHTGGKQIRNTEWFGKGKNVETNHDTKHESLEAST